MKTKTTGKFTCPGNFPC